MNYYLWLEQGGEGCDYTIGCGQKVIELDSENLQDAYLEAREKLDYYGIDRIENATLFQGSYNLDWMIKEVKNAKVEEEKQFLLSKKREQLERLKKELGEK